MELFVQIVFDLEAAQARDYEHMRVWAGSIGLSKTPQLPNGETVTLPRNTYAGVRNSYPSMQAAVEHVQKEFSQHCEMELLTGHAFVTACPADQVECGTAGEDE